MYQVEEAVPTVLALGAGESLSTETELVGVVSDGQAGSSIVAGVSRTIC